MSAVTTTLGQMPYPSHTTRSGAMAKTGIICEASMNGRSARSRDGDAYKARARRSPNVVAIAIPRTISASVIAP